MKQMPSQADNRNFLYVMCWIGCMMHIVLYAHSGSGTAMSGALAFILAMVFILAIDKRERKEQDMEGGREQD